MLKLTDSVAKIPKIGTHYQKLLEKLEIHTVEDLLYHFPQRFDDYSQIKSVAELMINDVVTVEAELTEIDNIFTRNGKRLTRAKIIDNTGELDVLWFNQHFIKNTLDVGSYYSFSGKIEAFSNKLIMMNPTFEKQGKNLNTGRLVSIYPETNGVSSKWIRARVWNILKTEIELDEFLPKELLQKYDLISIKQALEFFHFPQGKTEAEQAKKRFAFEEAFLELMSVEKRKAEWQKELKGISFDLEKNRHLIKDFTENLPFVLTDSQQKACEEILENMTHQHPMNRLLEGDVGSGKTVVAAVAAYFAFVNGYKTLYMAPTEILAVQHYETFVKLFDNLSIRVTLRTGSKKSVETENANVIVGTHALLHMKQPVENVGLVIIDEQHRFGVEQRSKLTAKDELAPHLLTMTATPIPRTMALTLYGDLSISALEPLPHKKDNIKTWVVSQNKRESAYEWIAQQNAPTFIVCPLIEQSESESLENVKAAKAEFDKLTEGPLKSLSVGLLHGRMKPNEKRAVIEQFKTGKITVLVSTPVIEVGIDIPEATIIVIESAERYGLSSLHQLRGRVGRDGRQGYCIVLASKYNEYTVKRLKNLEAVKDGLKLAEIDMQLRGHGDLYGIMQHGFKRFKLADISNSDLWKSAKHEAEKIFDQLDRYQELRNKLHKKDTRIVGRN